MSFSRNGYKRVPTFDPHVEPEPFVGKGKSKKSPKNLRPGLFYMFGDRGKYTREAGGPSDSDETIEMSELVLKKPKPRPQRRNKGPRSPKTVAPSAAVKYHIVEEPILEGDTVQRVALRYGCPDSEIRRVNNLFRDQDFFALKTVKVPVRLHGVLTEHKQRQLRREKIAPDEATTSGQSSTSDKEMRLGGPGTYYQSGDENSGDADDEVGDSDGLEVRDVSIQSALKWKYSRTALLEKFDEELQRVREDTHQRALNFKEVAVSLESPAFHPIVAKKPSVEMQLLSLDWRCVVIILVILGVGAVLFVVFFIVFIMPHHPDPS